MSAWMKDELHKITKADDLHISPLREDFELSPKDMEAIAALDTKQSLFLDHRDSAIVKTLGTIKFNTQGN